MNKINFKYIYERTRLLLLKPDIAWSTVLKEDSELKKIYKNYLLPIAATTTLLTFLLSLIDYNLYQSIALGIINFLAVSAGTWLSYRIAKEYLCGKLNIPENQALNITVYCSAIFITFHSIGSVLGNAFFGQLFTLLSFIFIRTLYVGLQQVTALKPGQRTNIFVILCVSIICMPAIITQLLRILLDIPALNI
ncbi:MAG: hypothetical protein RR137_04135 [Odoribacter sp.]